MITIETAGEIQNICEKFEAELQGFVGAPIDVLTINAIEETTRTHLLAITQLLGMAIDASKVGVCDVKSCIQSGNIELNSYTQSLMQLILSDATDS